MNSKPWQQTIILPLALIGMMDLTRFDHFGSAFSLPDASLAVFFFAGLSSAPLWFFGLLLLEAGFIDYVAVAHFNVSDFCISSAYLFLIPAYGIMWFAGRYAKTYTELHFIDSLKAFGVATISTTVSFLISNGSFYLLSGSFGTLSLNSYSDQLIHYYPPYLASSLIYIVIGLALVKLWKTIELNSIVES
ncbi:MAG: hypothetical protein IPN42_01425 [Methylococcaceae bacterium]|nr:hypothetical protein [Methylococcaceae bacterium]